MADTMMIPFQPLCLAHTAHGLYEQKINAKAYGEKRSHFHAGSKEIRVLKTELIRRRRRSRRRKASLVWKQNFEKRLTSKANGCKGDPRITRLFLLSEKNFLEEKM